MENQRSFWVRVVPIIAFLGVLVVLSGFKIGSVFSIVVLILALIVLSSVLHFGFKLGRASLKATRKFIEEQEAS